MEALSILLPEGNRVGEFPWRSFLLPSFYHSLPEAIEPSAEPPLSSPVQSTLSGGLSTGTQDSFPLSQESEMDSTVGVTSQDDRGIPGSIALHGNEEGGRDESPKEPATKKTRRKSPRRKK